MALSRTIILEEALALVDEHGLEGFTQRALGDRLGVSQMAVYHYFPTKTAIIDALADEILAGIRLADGPDELDPDEVIVGYALRARHALLAHRALVPVIVARPMAQASRADDLALLFATFEAAGFASDDVVDAVLMMSSVVLGLILYESQRGIYDRAHGLTYGDDRSALAAELADDPSAVVALVEQWSDDRGDDAFGAAVRALYEGLKLRAGVGST